jgi:hypothetical protein
MFAVIADGPPAKRRTFAGRKSYKRCLSVFEKRLGVLLTIFTITALLGSAALAGAASAQCSWVDCLSISRMLNNPNDYKWEGSWDPRFDEDWQVNYYGINLCDCGVRCELNFSGQRCRLR